MEKASGLETFFFCAVVTVRGKEGKGAIIKELAAIVFKNISGTG